MSHDGCYSGSHECRDCKHYPAKEDYRPALNRQRFCEKCSHFYNCQFEKEGE